MWLEPRMPIPHARPPVSRHLLGLGLLLVTMASGYAASLVYERPSVVVPVQESVAPGFEAEATQGDPWVATASNPGDRKSTRLNSSHVRISDAVFCLKKKKKQRRPHE